MNINCTVAALTVMVICLLCVSFEAIEDLDRFAPIITESAPDAEQMPLALTPTRSWQYTWSQDSTRSKGAFEPGYNFEIGSRGSILSFYVFSGSIGENSISSRASTTKSETYDYGTSMMEDGDVFNGPRHYGGRSTIDSA